MQLFLAAIAAVALSTPLQAVIDNPKSELSPDQAHTISSSIRASPELEAQLAALAADGRLKGIRVEPLDQLHMSGPFSAGIEDGFLVFTPTYLDLLSKNKPFDIVYPHEIYPNNYVFALGHLAYHLANPAPPMSLGPIEYSKLRLEQEARAFIQGWNDVVDAAAQENGGKPLTGAQAGLLLLNFRYRFAFIPANQSAPKVHFEVDGKLNPNAYNVNVTEGKLGNSPIPDIM